ncbi:MAG TPA: hypothetical protein EYQ31_06165 [Candidatus Handelsmanbacteria bacterium]|nr:hypothetical protein [Candidatus Handelsmanbacteria bacterium]
MDTLANRCAQWAIGGGYRTWVPQWAAEMYAEETQKIAQVLQDAGITDELLEELAVRRNERPAEKAVIVASQLIKALQAAIDKHGDRPVAVSCFYM